MKVLVLGGAGMLGHKVVQRLSAGNADLWWTLRAGPDDASLAPVPMLASDHAITRFDAERFDDAERVIQELRPNVVVNCLGVVKQRPEAELPVPSIAINSLFPHRLARVLGSFGARLIHISTDCVFSGDRGNYSEEDEPDPVDLYGRSKALGEVIADNTVTIRTSMIGRELRYHRGLLDWFLAQRTTSVRGFRHALWSGVTTLHLAEIIDHIIHDHRNLTGLFQVSSGRISKFDLLRLLRSAYGRSVEIVPDDAVHCDRSLVGTRFETATGYRCPPLQELIARMVADPTPYPSLS